MQYYISPRSRYSKENFPNILKIADGLKAVGERHGGASAGQVALAWLLAQGDDIIPIPGTKRIKVNSTKYTIDAPLMSPQYLHDNLGAASLRLSDEDVADVRAMATAADAAQGERYPPDMAAILFADTPEL